MSISIIVTLVFYFVSYLAGRYLYANRGSANSEKNYTVRKFLPWILGYADLSFLVSRTGIELLQNFGTIATFIIYIGYFLIMSVLFRTMMMFVKNFSLYCDECFNDSSDNFFTWLHKRNEARTAFHKKYPYDVVIPVPDVDMVGWYAAIFTISTILILFTGFFQ